VFRLTLPISQAAVIASDRLGEEGGDLGGLNVLLIEDDESVLAAMSDLLMSWGCACETASSVDQALARLDAFTPHLLLVDYRLRDHRSGLEAVSLIRERLGPDLPAFLVTGDTGPQRLREAHASGLVLLHKPVPAERLHAALLSQWRRAQGQAVGRASAAG
jgi:two-component system, sensor histidine kinase